uniref:Uncharacterized protein n=1 Tax=Manihot esculenta TaxID=3983 RepID=A0A2C9U9Q9_MANES
MNYFDSTIFFSTCPLKLYILDTNKSHNIQITLYTPLSLLYDSEIVINSINLWSSQKN